MTNLNEEQQRAVNTVYGPVLVLAGPGSGKTHTLTKRIKHMVEDVGISSSEILVITFSKKAAIEMQERYDRINENKSGQVYFGTFHAVFYSMLRTHAGFNQRSVLSHKDKLRILKKVFLKKGINIRDEASMYEYLEYISEYKNASDKDLYISRELGVDIKEDFTNVFKDYEDICKIENKLDFDDMLYMCRDLLLNNIEVRRVYQNLYKYILIDEFQDINTVQYEILELLAGENNNIFAVGDDDQSIYGFRGSRPELMKRFMTKPGCEVINMSINYRCSKNIVNLANTLINNNINRIEKCQIPNCINESGFVSIEVCSNALKEAEFVCNKINEINKNNDNLSNIAVIYRTEKCVELLKEKLDAEGIFYIKSIRTENYYDTEWVKDIISYLKAALGNRTVESLSRILNKPERNLDRDEIRSYERDTSRSIQYNKMIRDLDRISNMSSYAAIKYILKGIGYEEYMVTTYAKRGYSREKIDKIIADLLVKVKEYENIKELLTYIDSIKELEKINEDNKNMVNMLTAHASKGLEFDTVFIVGLQEGIFPHDKAMTLEQLEEERRLLYVAITRAKRSLYIVGRGEYKHGKKISRFINELT